MEAGTGKCKALVADADGSAARVLAYMLRQAGFETRIAASFEEAVAGVRSWAPAVVLLDPQQLPGETERLIAELRAAAAPRDLRVALMLARDPSESIHDGSILADDVFHNPVAAATLVGGLARIGVPARRPLSKLTSAP